MSLEWYGDKIKLDINNASVKFLIRATNLVQRDAKLLVPVDTGNLRVSIVKAVDNNKLEGSVSTNTEYAPSIEFGTRRQRAQPFMRPALNDNKANILKIAEQEIKKVVN